MISQARLSSAPLRAFLSFMLERRQQLRWMAEGHLPQRRSSRPT